MKNGNVLLSLLFSFGFMQSLEVSAAAGDPCTYDANDEIIDVERCKFDAISLTYNVKEIYWCATLPTAPEIRSCDKWGVEPFRFTITDSSVTTLDITRDLPAGSYNWIVIVLEPEREVRAIATFSRVMQGSTGSGKVCWTNGKTINRGTDLWRDPDQNNWSAECGSQAPTLPSANVEIRNNNNFGPFTFANSYDDLNIDGTRSVGYLMDDNFNLATASTDVTQVASLHQLPTPVVVTGDPEKSQVYDITYDRSLGAEVFIHSDLGVNNLSRIDTGTFTFTTDYSEVSN